MRPTRDGGRIEGMTEAPAVDPWLSRELVHARELIDRGDLRAARSVLREADRVATAQGYADVRPQIAALGRAARPHPDTAALRRDRQDAERGAAVGDESGLPEPAPRHPNVRTIAYLWIGVLAASFVGAIVLSALGGGGGSGVAAGALGALSGGFVTFLYVGASVVISPPRRHPSFWVLAAIFLGGVNGWIVADLFDVDDIAVSAVVWTLIGAYVVASLVIRRRSRDPRDGGP